VELLGIFLFLQTTLEKDVLELEFSVHPMEFGILKDLVSATGEVEVISKSNVELRVTFLFLPDTLSNTTFVLLYSVLVMENGTSKALDLVTGELAARL